MVTNEEKELYAKNRAQGAMIAGYIALIQAAQDIGVYFLWEGKTAKAELPGERSREKWPRACHLCNKNMESEADRTEWHGLGNCVTICQNCMGTGFLEGLTTIKWLNEEFSTSGSESWLATINRAVASGEGSYIRRRLMERITVEKIAELANACFALSAPAASAPSPDPKSGCSESAKT